MFSTPKTGEDLTLTYPGLIVTVAGKEIIRMVTPKHMNIRLLA
jgi:hypothetical protein